MKIGWPLYACNEPFRFYPQKISTRGVVHWHGVPKIHKNWILILLPGRAADTMSIAAVVTGQVFLWEARGSTDLQFRGHFIDWPLWIMVVASFMLFQRAEFAHESS